MGRQAPDVLGGTLLSGAQRNGEGMRGRVIQFPPLPLPPPPIPLTGPPPPPHALTDEEEDEYENPWP